MQILHAFQAALPDQAVERHGPIPTCDMTVAPVETLHVCARELPAMINGKVVGRLEGSA